MKFDADVAAAAAIFIHNGRFKKFQHGTKHVINFHNKGG